MKNQQIYDFIIIGAGGTGLAAAMYGARLNMKVLVLGTSHGSEMPLGGVITTTKTVENYPGFKKISGFELAKNLEQHARDYKNVEIQQQKVVSVTKNKNLFSIKTQQQEYSSKTILFATGTKWKKLDVPGAKEFENRGVSYCALCECTLFKDKVVAVVGGSDSAAIEALLLAEYAKKVYIIYRKEKIRAEPTNLKRIQDNKKIQIINNTNVIEIKGNKRVEKVVLDRVFQGNTELELDGLFIAIGHQVLSDLAENLQVELDEKQQIKIDHKTSETNIPGVFAAGDVTDKPFKQLITGVADGCTAAHSAYEYIKQHEN